MALLNTNENKLVEVAPNEFRKIDYVFIKYHVMSKNTIEVEADTYVANPDYIELTEQQIADGGVQLPKWINPKGLYIGVMETTPEAEKLFISIHDFVIQKLSITFEKIQINTEHGN